MDLKQTKLSKPEWESIEIPVNAKEKQILALIKKGYKDVNYSYNVSHSLIDIAKLEDTQAIQEYLFKLYLLDALKKTYKSNNITRDLKMKSKVVPKKRDVIRIDNTKDIIEKNRSSIYEFTILEVISKLFKSEGTASKYYYSLFYLNKCSLKMNTVLLREVEYLLELFQEKIDCTDIIKNSYEYIEKNPYLYKFTDVKLYDHQKEIFTLFKQKSPKFVFYVAPTGTGKTLTPIGLSENYRIIFVCAARHIGLALAKSAISAHKKIALAFNCTDSEHIRLHFSAAKEFVKHRKTGGIFKVDNSVGDNVEIMISDIKSYQTAMLYMSAFNKKEDIITYWDEPTISMDYDEHPFHEMIHENWKNNIIPNIVFSSATLPNFEDIPHTIGDYKQKFPEGNFHTIISSHCLNSIPLLSKTNEVVLPHHLHETWSQIKSCMEYCSKNSALIRYMDLKEISKFIMYLNEKGYIKSRYKLENYFETCDDITMKSIKDYYLQIFKGIDPENWGEIYGYFNEAKQRNKVFDSSIYLSTKDAYTLTHGPTIYLTDDVEKIGKFCLQQAKIPGEILEKIDKTVRQNDLIIEEINKLQQIVEDMMAKFAEKENKMANENRFPPEVHQHKRKIENLQARIGRVSLPSVYVPNTTSHFNKWCSKADDKNHAKNLFKAEITPENVMKLMKLNDIEPIWKLLLLMGIGTFMNHKSSGYVEIMKEMAENQKLLLIIASSDYIYGTNYQFCHGYIGKDLIGLTQEKIIQSLGRIGRNHSDKNYSIRFRDDSILRKVFDKLDINKEGENMNKIFCS